MLTSPFADGSLMLVYRGCSSGSVGEPIQGGKKGAALALGVAS